MAARRTAEESASPLYNYCLALDIDPEMKKKELSLAVNRALSRLDSGSIGTRLLQLRSDIKMVLVEDALYDEENDAYLPNSGGRKAEADAAKRFMLEKKTEDAKEESSLCADSSDKHLCGQDENITDSEDAVTDTFSAEVQERLEAPDEEKRAREAEIAERYGALYSKAEALIKKGEFYNAAAVVKKLISDFADYETEKTDRLADATVHAIKASEELLARAEGLIGNGDISSGLRLAFEALGRCCDCVKAKEIISQNPPTPPTDIKAYITPDEKVKISWRSDTDAGEEVKYIIIRKSDSKPGYDDDIGTTFETSFTDASAESCTSYYYGVISERYGVRSLPLIRERAICLYSKVKNLKQRAARRTDGR